MPTYTNTRKSGSRKTGYRGTTTGSYSGGKTTRSYSPSAFNKVGNSIQQKIGSFRTVWSQFKGASTANGFSPTIANKFVNLINSGASVYKFTNNDFTRWFGSNFSTKWSTATAYRNIRQQLGAGVKAVTRGKGSCWLIAATNVTARPFNTYNWNA